MKSFWILYLLYIVGDVSGDGEVKLSTSTEEYEDEYEDPYCLRYTWLPPPVEPDFKLNCSYKGVPCIQPVLDTDEPPNVDELLDDPEHDIESITCPLIEGQFCIKYSITYNNAPVNVSRFCGKLIDGELSVSPRCYTQVVDGLTIEACACQSGAGENPCNGAMYSIFSTELMIFVMFISFNNIFKL